MLIYRSLAMKFLKQYTVIIGFTLLCSNVLASGFLHTRGKQIVNGAGENVILRGIGTGNWLLQEGYMMKTVGVANTQTQFRNKLIETIGVEKTDSFYTTWLNNHFTRKDVEAMHSWGFNSVRVAMHYKWLTLPIEEEPVKGEQTWLEDGFTRLDSLLDWCGDNNMYLILDLHGAPGGQGKDEAISDYDPSKPSLWESAENHKKTVALWQKLAQRYANEPWIGGYDLINETNWTFPQGNNSPLRKLFEEITDSIRAVDANHILFIEGNSFANDHSGLTPPWDNNLVYSFHKYWNPNDPHALDWIIRLRDSYNVPLWLGETGENSNTWFTDLIHLSESKNIGWSWWPVKKAEMNNVLNVKMSDAYQRLINYWKGEGPALTEAEAFDAVMDWANNQKFENCIVQYDVIDAMLRQPHTSDVKPFKAHSLTAPIFCTEFDLGKNTFAYYDLNVENTSMEFTSWNNGWAFRNDGVDIETCFDGEPTNGYNVGWTEDGEWMQYTLPSDSAAVYKLNIRHASGGSGSSIHIEANGVNVSGSLHLPGTGGWGNWQTDTFENIILPQGNLKLKLVFETGGSNLNYFEFSEPKSVNDVAFKMVSAETSEDGYLINLSLNKEITTSVEDLNMDDFTLWVNNIETQVDEVLLNASSNQSLVLKVNNGLYSDQNIQLSYAGNSVKAGEDDLEHFTSETVLKKMATSERIPGKIQAEDFYINNGFELEDCTDTDNGKNTSYANTGDFLVYKVHVTRTGFYRVIYRVATERSNSIVKFQAGDLNAFENIDTIHFDLTGGWQTWDAQTSEVYLEEGYYFIRLYVLNSEHNLNWFQFNFTGTPATNLRETETVKLYPNPAKNNVFIDFSNSDIRSAKVEIYDLAGNLMLTTSGVGPNMSITTQQLKPGAYVLKIRDARLDCSLKLLIQ